MQPHLRNPAMTPFVRASAIALLMITTAAPAALAAPAPAPASAPAQAADTLFHATTLNLSAYGETRIAPDMASINLGVNTEAPTAGAAMQANATQMGRIMAALKKAGIADKDVQTSNLNLSAQYDYVQNLPPKLRGYQASNQVTVVVHDLTRLGAAVDATVAAGANQVNGISFGLSDPTAAEDAARQAAVKALGAKANLYAGATGYRIARLVSLSEGGGYSPAPPQPLMAMARMAKADTTSVAPGELEVRIEINGVYELTR
jgi:uncharacterized protein YggE